MGLDWDGLGWVGLASEKRFGGYVTCVGTFGLGLAESGVGSMSRYGRTSLFELKRMTIWVGKFRRWDRIDG